MPLYMDIHEKIRAMTPRALNAAHERSLSLQAKHGVSYRGYWVNPEAGKMFCLLEAPSREAAVALHREAHGLLPNEIWEVCDGAQLAVPALEGENRA